MTRASTQVKNALVILLAGAFSSCLSCSRSSVTVAPLGVDQVSSGARRSVDYSTAWQAIWHFDIERSREIATTEPQKMMANGFESVMSGELGTAEQAFRQLLFSEDPETQEFASFFLDQLLISQLQWKKFLSVTRQEPSSWDAVLARALRDSPAEVYRFAEQPAKLPIGFQFGILPTITVTIGGFQWRFLLDTGTAITIVASDVAEKCGIEPSGTETGRINTDIEYLPAIADLGIGELSVRNHPVALVERDELPIGNGSEFDGVIGWPLIQRVRLELDYANGYMTIREPELSSNQDRNLFHLLEPLVNLSSQDGSALSFFIDTGSSTSMLSPKGHGKLGMPELDRRWTLSLRFGGYRLQRVDTLPDAALALGTYGLWFQNMDITPMGSSLSDGRLGSDVFSHGRITIDFQNGHFSFDLPDSAI